MPEDQSGLGGRLPLLKPAQIHGDQKSLYNLMQKQLIGWADANCFKGQTPEGELIGPFNPYLYSPDLTRGFLQWMQADSQHTSLNKRVHEIVILTVGAIWKSPFELYAHSAVARMVGVSQAAIEALVDGRSPNDLTKDEQVAHRFAHQLASTCQVEDALYQEAEYAFGQRALVDMVYLVGMYLLTCALLNAFRIPAPK